jgi:lipopolysaccharide export system protein LptA
MNPRCLVAAGTLAALLLLPRPAPAQGLDLSRGGPIEVVARDGIDWIQNEQKVVARGDARAARGNVTVTADTLIAYYRKKNAPGAPAAAAAGGAEPVKPAAASAPPGPSAAGGKSPGPAIDETASNEVYRLEAVGHVHVFTATDQAWGEHAVYDMDQAVLVMTGRDLKLTTPQDVLTAKDDMEYWSQRRMAVARGDAVVTTSDGRRISADTLVGYLAPSEQRATAVPAKPGAPGGKPAGDALLDSGKLERVEAFGNADVRTATETVHGDRGVYVTATEKARIVGHVRITRGQNQVNGVAADVDMKSGVSTLLSGPSERVAGMIMPNETPAAGAPGKPAGPKPGAGNSDGAKPGNDGGAGKPR